MATQVSYGSFRCWWRLLKAIVALQDILLFGLGGVGATYAFILNQSKAGRVSVCARSNYELVNSKGLDFQSERYGNHPNYKFHKGNCIPPFVR